jgi:hypothetical protein
MRKALFFFVIAVSLLPMQLCVAADPPRQIAGLMLGGNIKQYENLLQMSTSLPIRHMEYLSEVETKPLEGFRKGYISYGNCDEPGRIVRIRLKYEREDKEFFDALLEQFKKKFGSSAEYRGDAFRAFIAWKWTFSDKDNNRITLQLQHNSEDNEDEITRGNSVKLSISNLSEKERECYEKKHPEDSQGAAKPAREKNGKQVDFKRLIPE